MRSWEASLSSPTRRACTATNLACHSVQDTFSSFYDGTVFFWQVLTAIMSKESSTPSLINPDFSGLYSTGWLGRDKKWCSKLAGGAVLSLLVYSWYAICVIVPYGP